MKGTTWCIRSRQVEHGPPGRTCKICREQSLQSAKALFQRVYASVHMYACAFATNDMLHVDVDIRTPKARTLGYAQSHAITRDKQIVQEKDEILMHSSFVQV